MSFILWGRSDSPVDAYFLSGIVGTEMLLNILLQLSKNVLTSRLVMCQVRLHPHMTNITKLSTQPHWQHTLSYRIEKFAARTSWKMKHKCMHNGLTSACIGACCWYSGLFCICLNHLWKLHAKQYSTSIQVVHACHLSDGNHLHNHNIHI